jgi:hypothetical protein
MVSLLATLACGAVLLQGETSVQNDLVVTTFKLPEGTVTVYLPNDLRHGDTITGTVIDTPAGSGSLLQSNAATLEGVVIEIEGKPQRPNGRLRSWVIPAGVGAVAVRILTAGGKPLGTTTILTIPPNVGQSSPTFNCDPVQNAAGPLTINGPFDGNAANTNVNCGPNPMTVMAESPRSCVVAGPPSTPGKTNISVDEAGNKANLPCNLVKMTMTASKTTLLRGEKTTVTVKVSGLEGLSKTCFPIPLEFVNETPAIIRFQQTTEKRLPVGMPQNSVKDGIGTMQIGLVGINPGKFILRGLAYNTSIHDIKKLLNAPAFNIWLDALIVKYEAEIKALEASGATDGGTKSKIGRKKKTLSVLKGNRNATPATLSDCKEAVDLALAEDSFFELAKELLVTAADLLGYTDIPIPALGKILKGLEAVAAGAKLVKTLAALERAQALAAAYDALSNVAEKVEKLAELKDAVNAVKEALASEQE